MTPGSPVYTTHLVHSRGQQRTAEDSRGQQRTAEDSRGQQRTAEDSRARHNTTQHNTTQHNTTQQSTAARAPERLLSWLSVSTDALNACRRNSESPSWAITDVAFTSDSLMLDMIVSTFS
jgi:hypothetical protein